MKSVYPLLTLLSASLVAAAPAAFVVTDAMVAADIAPSNTDFNRREVRHFDSRALRLRGALVDARGEQAKASTKVEDPAAADAEQAKGKGKGKEKDAQARKSTASYDYMIPI
jgi:hypothetical protein